MKDRLCVAALRWKPKARQVRIIYSDGERLSGVDSVTKNPDKVFAVIGPFDGHTDKQDLQDALETLLRGYNLESEHGPGRIEQMNDALTDANTLCRLLYAVAARGGKETNWPSLTTRIEKSLRLQNKLGYGLRWI